MGTENAFYKDDTGKD